MKSEDVEYMLGLWHAIQEDFVLEYPELRVAMDRDRSRLHSLIEREGLSVFTLILPDIGRHLDKCLSESSFTRRRGALSRPFRRRGVVPRFLKEVHLRIFDEFGALRPDCDVNSIRYLRQLYFVGKKWQVDYDDESRDSKVAEFFALEYGLRGGTLGWDGDELALENARDCHFGECHRDDRHHPQGDLFEETLREPSPYADVVTPGLLNILQETADVISSSFGSFDPWEFLPKHGPGAVSDLQANYESKYRFPNWPRKLEYVFPYADFAYANYGLWADASLEGSFSSEHEPPSKLIAVPKDARGPRLIAAEPTSHQWCQQILWRFFKENLCMTPLANCVDFSSQQRNRDLAREGSITGGLWTIDLSSASDCVSTWHVERLFRSNTTILSALHACRTRYIRNDVSPNFPKFIRLKKFASMGSACTFPVETILFATIVLACEAYASKQVPTRAKLTALAGRTAIFGDDIIVSDSIGPLVIGLLSHLGFKVNPNKTLTRGILRESCGFDGYAGADITPTYAMGRPIRTAPETVISVVETSNNFFRSYMTSASTLLAKAVRSCYPRVPAKTESSGDFGLMCPWAHASALPGFVTTPSSRAVTIRDRGDSTLLRYFVETGYGKPDFWSAALTLRSRPKLRTAKRKGK